MDQGKIIFNYNFCDLSPECGGIAVCQYGAMFYDEKKGRPIWDRAKCRFCLKCTAPGACPVGCILYARNRREALEMGRRVKEDQKLKRWLWKERYGVGPGITPPLVTRITEGNGNEFLSDGNYKLLDVWHSDLVDCRLHSPLYEDVLGDLRGKVEVYKLNAGENFRLAKELGVEKFPSLVLLKGRKEMWRFEGLMDEGMMGKVKSELDRLVA